MDEDFLNAMEAAMAKKFGITILWCYQDEEGAFVPLTEEQTRNLVKLWVRYNAKPTIEEINQMSKRVKEKTVSLNEVESMARLVISSKEAKELVDEYIKQYKIKPSIITFPNPPDED